MLFLIKHRKNLVVTCPYPPMAKADHSKVMVINGKQLDGSAVAYVASKNWLDTSGGITFDEVIKVRGPAATIIQDNYVPDMIAALTKKYEDIQKQREHDDYLKLLLMLLKILIILNFHVLKKVTLRYVVKLKKGILTIC